MSNLVISVDRKSMEDERDDDDDDDGGGMNDARKL
jgi:hypothetical protein